MSDKLSPSADDTYPGKITPRPLLISSKVKREANPVIILPALPKPQAGPAVGSYLPPPVQGAAFTQPSAPETAELPSSEETKTTVNLPFASEKEEEPALPNDTAGDRYEIFETLGQGVAGIVSKARELATGKGVALKKIHPHFLPDAESRIRFRGLLRTLATLQHDHLFPVQPAGMLGSAVYFAMPIATGGSLNSDVRRNKRVFKKTARLVSQIASALHFAHQRGILHGNLKPANILFDQNNHPYVADFGQSPADLHPGQGEHSRSLIPYLAPERLEGQPATVASDVYSLGAILYELLTDKAPFADVPHEKLLRIIKTELPQAPRGFDRAIPPDVELICLRSLAIHPAERYPSAHALAEDLENWLAKRPLSIREPSLLELLWTWMRRKPIFATFLALVSLLLILAAIFSSIGLMHVFQDKKRAETDVAQLSEQLWQSSLAQARAARQSRAAGSVSQSLDAIRTAASIRTTSDLRSEAAASLATADLQIVRRWAVRTHPEPLPVLFSPDLKLTFRATVEGSFEILATEDQRILGRIRNKTQDPITAIAPLMSYGHLVATRSVSGTIRVWESVAPGAIVFELPGEPAPDLDPWARINFAVDPAGLFAVGQADGRIALYELVLGSPARFISSGEKITHLAFDPSGRHLAVVRQNRSEIEIIDPTQPDRPPLVLRQDSPVTLLSWSHDSQQIAATGIEGLISIWQADTGTRTSLIRATPGVILSQLLFTHSGTQLATTGNDSTIRLWNIAARAEESRLEGFGGEPVMRFSSDDTRLLATDGSTTGVELAITFPQICHTHAPLLAGDSVRTAGLDFSHDHQTLAIATQATIQVRDLRDGRLLASEISTSGPAPGWTAAFAPFSQSLYLKPRGIDLERRSIRRDGAQLILGSSEQLAILPGFDIAGFNKGGTLLGLVNPETGEAKVYNPANLKILSAAQLAGARDFAINPSGSHYLLSGASSAVFNVADGKKIHQFDSDSVNAAAWSPDGKWIAASGSKGVRLWSANDWSAGPVLPDESARLGTYLAWSPDGRLFALSVGDKVEIYDARDFSHLLSLYGPLIASNNPRLQFSRDSKHLALLGHDGALQLWHFDDLRKALKAENLDW